MDTLQLIESLDDAIRTIAAARVQLAGGSSTIWRLADHAASHLDKQIKELLAPAAPEVPSIATQIHKVLNGQEWSSDTLSDIAEILTSNGYKIADCAPAPEVYVCNGCGREESICSETPCLDVIADREAVS